MKEETVYECVCMCYIYNFTIKWMGHVTRIGRRKVHTEFWWGNLRERDHLEDPGVGGRIILCWTFRKWNGRAWTGLIWLEIGIGGGLL